MSDARFRLSRRGFIGGAAALAVPTLIPRHVLGDEKNVPANEKMLPMVFHKKDVEVQGAVIGVLRKY